MTSNVKTVVKQLRAVEPTTQKAIRRALNKIGEQSKTLTLRLLHEATGVTQTKLRPYVRVRRADYSDLSAAVVVTPHTFNIASFPGAHQVKPSGGVVFSFRRNGRLHNVRAKGGGVISGAWGSQKLYPHTFMIQGGRTAMHRVGAARYPIKPSYGPRIHAEFAKDPTIEALSTNVRAKFPMLLRHELDFALGRYGLQAQ